MEKEELFQDIDFGDVFGGLEGLEEDDNVVIKKDTKEPIEADLIEEPEEPEVVEKDEPDKTPPSSVTDDKDINSSSDYRVFAKALHESGVIQEFDDDEFSEKVESEGVDEALISLVTSTIDKEVSSRLEGKDELYKEFVKKIEGGVPADVVATQVADLKKLESISDDMLTENDDLAKNIIAVELKHSGYSEERINRRIQSLEDFGSLGEEAVEALKSIKTIRKNEIEAEDRKFADEKRARDEDKKNRFKEIKDSVYSTEELIPGIKLNKQVKDQVLTHLTKVVSTEDGKNKNAIMHHRDKNPVAFDKMVAYLYQIGAFNLDSKGNLSPKWDKVLKTSKSNAISELSSRFSKPSSAGKGGKTIAKFSNEPEEESFISSIDIDNFGRLETE